MVLFPMWFVFTRLPVTPETIVKYHFYLNLGTYSKKPTLRTAQSLDDFPSQNKERDVISMGF